METPLHILNAQTKCASALRLPHETERARQRLPQSTTRREADMLTKVDSTFSASEGTLAGDILWLATIAFVFAIITGIVG